MEYRVAARAVMAHDFREGVRATLIDKDGEPRWQPAALAAVSDADIAGYFAPLGARELQLADTFAPIDFTFCFPCFARQAELPANTRRIARILHALNTSPLFWHQQNKVGSAKSGGWV